MKTKVYKLLLVMVIVCLAVLMPLSTVVYGLPIPLKARCKYGTSNILSLPFARNFIVDPLFVGDGNKTPILDGGI